MNEIEIGPVFDAAFSPSAVLVGKVRSSWNLAGITTIRDGRKRHGSPQSE